MTYFCVDDNDLLSIERMMQEGPGYRPRGSGICISSQDFFSKQKQMEEERDKMIVRLASYKLPVKIVDCIMKDKKENAFSSGEHKKRFSKVYQSLSKQMKGDKRFLASVFLLTFSDNLWRQVRDQVTNEEITFENIRIRNLTVDEYVLFHVAKDIYLDKRSVTLEELCDPFLVSEEIFEIAITGYALKFVGLDYLVKGGEIDG